MARRGNPQTNLSVNYEGDGILGTKNSVVLINTSENNEKSLLKGEKGKTSNYLPFHFLGLFFVW